MDVAHLPKGMAGHAPLVLSIHWAPRAPPVLHLTGVPPKLTERSIMPHVAVQARVSELKALLVRPTGLPPERQRIIYRCCSLVGTAVACHACSRCPSPA